MNACSMCGGKLKKRLVEDLPGLHVYEADCVACQHHVDEWDEPHWSTLMLAMARRDAAEREVLRVVAVGMV